MEWKRQDNAKNEKWFLNSKSFVKVLQKIWLVILQYFDAVWIDNAIAILFMEDIDIAIENYYCTIKLAIR